MKIKVTKIKSTIGYSKKQKLTMKGLGLKKMNQEVLLENTDSVRGMIDKVKHLVSIEIV